MAFTKVETAGISSTGNLNLNGPVLIGSATSTGTASQPLQVTGGAYVSGNLGIGTTNPTSKLQVIGDVNISGVITATSVSSSTSGIRRVSISTESPIGGSDGDIWIKYTA